jgi:phenylacetate-CoA ligase
MFFNRELETMDRKQLNALQLERVKEVVNRAYNKSKFYHEHFNKAGVKPEDIKTLDDFRKRVPFMTKKDLVEAQRKVPPYGGLLCVPENKIRQIHITAGTSGRGQEVHATTQADYGVVAEALAYQLAWADFKPGEVSAVHWPIATMSGGQVIQHGLKKFGMAVLALAMFDTKTKLETMKRLNIHHIATTPAYLTRTTVVAQEMGIDFQKDFPRLKGILMSTESFPASWAVRMQEIWGVKLYDVWGSSQVIITYASTCEKGVAPGGKFGVYHLLEPLAYIENIDPETGEPINYGEEGEPVINTFWEGMPMIRFRQEDKVKLLPPEACDCGRTWDCWEMGTISRYDDMIKMKGINVWPSGIDTILFGCPEIDEYNGRVFLDEKGAEHIRISVEFKKAVVDPEIKERLILRLSEELLAKMGLHMEVVETPPGTVEHFEYKARRWTDERIQGLERVKFVERK